MMKKTILLLLAAFCGVLTVAAQDLIIKADASKVEAKVTEITPESVRYKRFSNPDGPTYVLPVSEISYIQYANGEKEYFRAAASIPATPLTPALPAEEPATVSAAPAAAEAPVSYTHLDVYKRQTPWSVRICSPWACSKSSRWPDPKSNC